MSITAFKKKSSRYYAYMNNEKYSSQFCESTKGIDKEQLEEKLPRGIKGPTVIVTSLHKRAKDMDNYWRANSRNIDKAEALADSMYEDVMETIKEMKCG